MGAIFKMFPDNVSGVSGKCYKKLWAFLVKKTEVPLNT